MSEVSFLHEWLVGSLFIEAAIHVSAGIIVLMFMAIQPEDIRSIKGRSVLYAESAIALFALSTSLVATIFS